MNIDCLTQLAQLDQCLGKYCARQLVDSATCNFTSCQKCPWGYRPNKRGICELCTQSPSLYDYTYLGFMFNIAVILHFLFIDNSFSNIKKKRNNLSFFKLTIIYLLPLVESVLAFMVSILLFKPVFSFKLLSCPVNEFADWYSVFYNPSIDYYTKTDCSQEIVYPLYSLVMLFYVLSVVIMLILRGLAKRLILTNRIYVEYLNKATFAALYFYPIMFIIHVVAAGVIYSTFPLITMFVFLISSNIHLSNVFKNEFDDHTNKLSVYTANCLKVFKKTRNIIIQTIHFYFFFFSIVSFTQFKQLNDLFYFLAVPIPFVFFLVSYKYSNPKSLI